MKNKWLLGFWLYAFVACSTTTNQRQIASTEDKGLDNNGDVVDDSIDQKGHLERYWNSFAAEHAANDEVAKVIRDAVAKQKKVRTENLKSQTEEAQTIFKDLPRKDYATRDVHRKTHGCFKGQLFVYGNVKEVINGEIGQYQNSKVNDLPADSKLEMIQDPKDLGVFMPNATYDTVLRLSNGNPGNNPDRQPDARGFAVKILPKGTLVDNKPIRDMDASKLNAITELDILTINFPTFFVNDPIKYAKLNTLALEGARDFQGPIEAKVKLFESLFTSSDLSALEQKLALAVNGSVIYSPLFQEYYSMVPSRLGPKGATRAVKYSWEPAACSNVGGEATTFEQEKAKYYPNWATEHDYNFRPVSKWLHTVGLGPNYLRNLTVQRLQRGRFCFNLYFQMYRDDESTRIEDSTDIWLKTETDRQWWKGAYVPSTVNWSLNEHNDETRDQYLTRFDKKQLAPAVLVARLELKQLMSEEVKAAYGNNKTCEDLSFNPWNGRQTMAYHKPLGIVSRMKRKVYNASRRERHELNNIDDKHIERDSN